MNQDLAYWETRLASHFTELSSLRSTKAPGRPIFALEHGLDMSEIRVLQFAIRAHIANSPPSKKHKLAWVVYAVEIGYGYSGDEYWQTFEEETPGWTIHGDRYWIRDCFRSFQREYGGAKPSGAWAENFSIICWPITHAILPRDLQRQLARILYELRDAFSAEFFESPSTIGEFISARSWNASSRFQNFTQETLLVGQIAAALLLQGELGTASLIHPGTLHRIGEDLERERLAREWLRGARRYAKERAHIRGLVLRPGLELPFPHLLKEAREEVAKLGIEPRLVLRPVDETGTSWKVSLEIPDLTHLLLKFPQTREILADSRCVVAGAIGSPRARGSCLYGVQRVVLARWPHTDEVLLKFEKTDAKLEYLLRTECLLRPGPSWLFRIASDGLAYELRSLRVRPGERYILVSKESPFALNEHICPIDLQCDGVYGALLNLPTALTSDWEELLMRFGLGQAKTIEVWPAGLAAVVWDGEGHGEWLVSERPCLAIFADHPIDGFIVSMDKNADLSLEVTSITPGVPIFVQLPKLPIGLHKVSVHVRSDPDDEFRAIGDVDVFMRIREVRPWKPGVSPHGPLIVQVEPTLPTLEELWEGQAKITLRGPTGRNVKCSASFFEREANTASITKKLPPIQLPVTPSAWRDHFAKCFCSKSEVQDAYDTARICKLYFTAGELGSFTVRCDREFKSLRWKLRRHGRYHFIRLLNDSGDDTSPALSRFAFETPCVEEKLELAQEYRTPESGGMYVARIQAFLAAIIVPPAIHGLAELKCEPHVDGGTRSIDTLLSFLEIARLWGRAKLPGNPFAATRQREVLCALVRQVFRIVCGENWGIAEIAVHNVIDGIARMRDRVLRGPEGTIIGEILSSNTSDLVATPCEERSRQFAALVKKTRLVSSVSSGSEHDMVWLSELALRLASDPVDIERWAGERLRMGLTSLLEMPALARAARFFVLAIDHHLRSHAAPGILYAGWEWT